MNKRAMSSIKAAITRFDNSCRSIAFKGGEHPDTWQEIEREYVLARESLERMIERNLK